MKQKIVYVAFSSDVLHEGILNIFRKACAYGQLVVGVLTDDEISKYRTIPMSSLEQRVSMVESIKCVDKVVVQKTLSYQVVLQELSPDYILHGDDWVNGSLSCVRSELIELLKDNKCQLVEIPYTDQFNHKSISEHFDRRHVNPVTRKGSLGKLLSMRNITRVLEAHNGLSSLIVENSYAYKKGDQRSFDAIWISSLTDSTAKGKPDTELVDMSSRVQTIQEIMEVTTKPVIVDGDTGGKLEHIPYKIKTLERLGVSAYIIEDKIGLKRNSLFGTTVPQQQDSIENFSKKIEACKYAKNSDDFMIFARIESLILNQPVEDALKRAKAYINAGADGILIHSKDQDTGNIEEFCKQYNSFDNRRPLVVVPTAYCHISEEELVCMGVDVVIYANHLIRSAYPAMLDTAKKILENGRSLEATQDHCMSVKEIINLIPESI